MIKVVLDANQFVSAILTSKGNPAKIIDLIEQDKIILLISDDIFKEVKKVLLCPRIIKLHGYTPVEIDTNLKKLIAFARFTQGKIRIEAIKDDPSDNIYLECAVEREADYIISGDHHLTDLKIFRGIRIVNPATFLNIITFSDR